MRKTSYVVAFLAVVVTLILNILSTARTDWIVYKSPTVLGTCVIRYYGLSKLCEYKTVNIPDSDSWSSYSCRKFPIRKEDCAPLEGENNNATVTVCNAYNTAGYAAEIAIGFAAISLIAIIVGVSTRSRRRRIWKAVAALVGLQTALQIVCFTLVTHVYRTEGFPTFEHARPGFAYVINTVSWVLGVLVTTGVVVTGISAAKGHKWAAGNRAYRPIEG